MDARSEEAAAAIDEARGALERAASVLRARAVTPEGDLAWKALGLLRDRHKRAEHFPVDFFGEPGWDALLTLYVAPENEMRQIDLFSAARVPQTTGLRWQRRLEQEGLVVTRAGPNMRTKLLVKLTPAGLDRLSKLLREL